MHDTWLVFRRELSHRLRQPVWLIMGITQPVLYMFFFGPLLESFVKHTPGFPPGNVWQIFAPALMVQMVIIGSTFVGVNLLSEIRAGVFERFQISPASSISILFGKVLTVAFTVACQCLLIILLCCLVYGLQPDLLGMSISLLMVVVLSASLASVSYSVALRIQNEDSVSALLNALLMPMFLLSGTLLPITPKLAPEWLWRLSRVNPIAYVMDASRASFRGDFSFGSIYSGVMALTVVAVLSFGWGIITFSKEHP
ncbi:ABC transporter permease [Streptomyces sp. NPDC088847]|uniref:ABC transporter permease n=1 Tax=Streptomyces sp. NPDC088847 TaxID=3365909 RepID=UPI00382B6ADC